MGMTDTTELSIGERFAAHKHWRWMRGMVVSYPDARVADVRATIVKGTVDCIEGEDPVCYENGITRFKWNPLAGWLPDTDDPATLGCIEHGLVPAALQDPDACLYFDPRDFGWYVFSPKHDDNTATKPTKQLALLAALDEADDIVRRGSAGAPQKDDEFANPDELDDYDGDSDDDGAEDFDVREMQRALAYDHDSVPYDDPAETPTDPKLCTRPAPAQAVAARGFLESMRQSDADREAARLAKLRDKGPT